MRKRFFLNCLLIFVLVAVMSTSAFAISESDVESAVSASGKEAVSGNVLVWFLCAIAFLKVSQKIDSFLSSLGLNVGHTGGSMLSEAMIAMRAINTPRPARSAAHWAAAAVTVLLLHPGNPAVEARLRQAFSAAVWSEWQAAKSRAMLCARQRRRKISFSRSRRSRPSAGRTQTATPIPVRSPLPSSSGRTPASLTRISRRFLPAP